MYQLRELERGDLVTITRWRNSSELIQQLGATFRYINPEVDIKWFENYMANRNSCVRCAIVEDSEQNRILGLVSLTNIDQLNQSAVLHIMIGETEAQGRGLGTFAVKSMVKHAFLNLNLHRIELTVLCSNKRAQHVYEKCGFVREGTLRKAVYKAGKFEDSFQYSLLREDYLAE